jgi:hypothetical protein
VCGVPFCLAFACADPQAIIDIAEDHVMPVPLRMYQAGCSIPWSRGEPDNTPNTRRSEIGRCTLSEGYMRRAI